MNAACRNHQVVRRVHLQPACPGVLAVPDLLCAACGLYVVTVRPWPPQEEPMAKNTVHGGPSDARADPPVGPSTDTPAPEPTPGPAPADLVDAVGPGEEASLRHVEGGEDPSPGTSSSTSDEKPPNSPKKSAPARRSRARTTANRSDQAQTGNRTASSTGGGPTAATSATGPDSG